MPARPPLRQRIGEWQVAVRHELTPQKMHLFATSAMIKKRDREASLPLTGV
jgi:hypothetical protein